MTGDNSTDDMAKISLQFVWTGKLISMNSKFFKTMNRIFFRTMNSIFFKNLLQFVKKNRNGWIRGGLLAEHQTADPLFESSTIQSGALHGVIVKYCKVSGWRISLLKENYGKMKWEQENSLTGKSFKKDEFWKGKNVSQNLNLPIASIEGFLRKLISLRFANFCSILLLSIL